MVPCESHVTIRTVYKTYAAALKTTTHPKTLCRNHMLQLNIQCSSWWAYAPQTCRAKNTSIKLPSCIKLAFYFISWGRCTVRQPSKYIRFRRWLCWKYIMNECIVMKSRNEVGAWQGMELTAKQKGQHIYTSPWDAKRCVAERWISPYQISTSGSILTKTGRGLQHSDDRNARYIPMSLTHFCRSSQI